MVKKVLELSISYIADVVIDVKRKRFGENFVSLQDCLIIKQLMQQRMKRKDLVVKFVDDFCEEFFIIQNGVVTKIGQSLKKDIGNREIKNLIYDEDFIYLCICEIMINKLNNSIEHTCLTCNSYCCGGLSSEDARDCRRWTHNFNEDVKVSLKKILEIR